MKLTARLSAPASLRAAAQTRLAALLRSRDRPPTSPREPGDTT